MSDNKKRKKTIFRQFLIFSILISLVPIIPVSTILFRNLENAAEKELTASYKQIGLQYINNTVGGGFSLKGVILILLSVLSITMQQIYIRKYKDMFSVFDMTLGIVIIGFILFTLLAVGKHIGNGTLKEFFVPLLNMNYFIAILYLSVLSTIGTTFLTVYALSKITAVKVSMANNFSTLPSILAGILVLNETFTLMHWIGAVAIVAGVVFVNCFAPKNE